MARFIRPSTTQSTVALAARAVVGVYAVTGGGVRGGTREPSTN